MGSKIPLFSVIVPIYNVENYIGKCLRSITSQTCLNFELILVDDASTDRSIKIAEEFINSGNTSVSCKIIKHNDNKGISITRNAGIKAADGHFIVMIDGDDYVDSNLLETYDQILKDSVSDIDLIYNKSYFIVNEYGIKIMENNNCKEGFIKYDENSRLRAQFRFSADYLWQFAFKRQLFQNVLFPENCDYEDLLTLPALLNNASNVVIIKKTGYYYVKRSGSITQMRDSLSSRIFPFMKEIWKLYPLWKMQNCTELFYARYGKSLRDQLYALAFWVKDKDQSKEVIKQWSSDMPWTFVFGMLKNGQWQNLPVYFFIKMFPSQTLFFYKKIKSV